MVKTARQKIVTVLAWLLIAALGPVTLLGGIWELIVLAFNYGRLFVRLLPRPQSKAAPQP
jgi:hypothetical protein